MAQVKFEPYSEGDDIEDYLERVELFLTVNSVEDEGSATQQNCVRDYVIFTTLPKITPGLHWDYTRFAPGLHILVIKELAVIS